MFIMNLRDLSKLIWHRLFELF